jgi:hypothetical protein
MSASIDNSKSLLRELLRVNRNNLLACGYEKLDVSALTQLASIPVDAKYAEIRVESDITDTPALRYLMLGSVVEPTSSEGLALSRLDFFDITGYPNLINFRVIPISGGTNTLHIQYYK